MITVTCACGITFQTVPCDKNRKYCSRKCFHSNYQRRKGLKYKIVKVNAGWYKEKTNASYKTGTLSYQAIHCWLRKHHKYPEACQNCNEKRKLDWANISGEYRRTINDYIALCRKCHWYYDNQGILI